MVRRALPFVVALALLALLWTAPFASIQGRREVTSCADQVPPPHDTAALRLDVMRCAGAFFSARLTSAGAPEDSGSLRRL